MITIIINACSNSAKTQEKPMLNKLTEEEKYVMLEKGTERPFTGIYYDHFEKGNYSCKQCGAPLFSSVSKFHSGCGWPSFDEAIKGAVEEVPDADGRRTEIVCTQCKAHLGHVFVGEGFTDKNTRHCVNSICLNFEPITSKTKTDTAFFAGGCFWGMEYWFQKQDGVMSTSVGYTGGNIENPGYKQVCSGTTGHAEALEVVFDSSVVSYEKLVQLFFEIHDPEQIDRQGPDIGEQYRSAIFYKDEQQKYIAQKNIEILMKKGYNVVTELVPYSIFYNAEDYHQKYYEKTGKKPYCHIYTKRF